MASIWVSSNIEEGTCVNVSSVTFNVSAYDGKKERIKNVVFEQCIVGDDPLQPYVSKTLVIKQAPPDVIVIPPSDYMVFRYFWGEEDGKDLDTATEYLNTTITGNINGVDYSVDDNPVGFNMKGNSNPLITGTSGMNYEDALLRFGGDNMRSGNECVYINFKYLFETYEESLPQTIEIAVWGTWFSTMLNGNISFEISTYSGGTMVKDGYNFVNDGGMKQYSKSYSYNISTQKGSSEYKTKYTRIGTIYIDKDTKQIQMILGTP